MEWNTAQEVQPKDDSAQLVLATRSRTELGVVDELPACEPPTSYSVGPEFVKAVTYDCILNCLLPPSLLNESLEPFYRTNLRFL